MSNFITFQRDALDHPLLQDGERFRAWFWIVAKACWKPTRYDLNGRIITLERGQFCCSVRELAAAWGWSKSAVERFLARLKTETMIETASGTGRLVITVCNYAKYQDKNTSPETAVGAETGTAPRQQRDIKEQGNKGTIDEDTNVSPSLPRKRVSDPFVRPEWADVQVWADLLTNRKRKRLPNTATAYKRFLADIAKFSDDEWPPGRVLEHAVSRGWGAIFDPRPSSGNFHDRSQDNRGGAANGNHFRQPAPDGFAAATHRRIAEARSRDAAEAARRSDHGDPDGTGELPLAASGFLR